MKSEIHELFQIAGKFFIKEYKNHGGSQNILARELGITQSYLSSVLSGSRSASLELYSQIAEKLYGPIDKFLAVGRRIKEGQKPFIEKEEQPEDHVENLIARLTYYIVDHKRIEDELSDTKSFYEDIIQNLQSGVLVTNSDDTIIFANHFIFEIFGIRPESLLKVKLSSFHDKFPGMDTNECLKKYREAQKSLKPLFYETVKVVTPAGKKIYLSGWLIPKVKDGAFNGMSCTIRDTTRSQELTMLLKMSLDNNPYAIGITKQAEQGVYATTYYANRKMRELFGHEEADYENISIHESLDKCERNISNKKEWRKFLEKHFKEGSKGSILIKHTNGKNYTWTSENLVDNDGQPWGRMATVKEVGKSRKKENK
jgi:PAS domain S-box-containing protein